MKRYTIMAKNPCDFPEGSFIMSVYTGKVYQITRHYTNGMCNLLQPNSRCNENWNACNNAHFISLGISLGVESLLYAK